MKTNQHTDPNASHRKKAHIDLAHDSQVEKSDLDDRFYYEPILGNHPNPAVESPIEFLGKKMHAPIWVSSMTGGTAQARTINKNLAKAVGEFGLGMGLGSCRKLLDDDTYLADFDLRQYLGDQPFYANLGIAQVEELSRSNALDKIPELLQKLQADGLIIHINPLQEWIQPEGDRLLEIPILTLLQLLSQFPDISLIVKEVGQGFGPTSLKELMLLPIAAIEFGAAGGTNFSKLESLRNADTITTKAHAPLARIGHDALEMVQFAETILKNPEFHPSCKQFIISGGVSNYLDGYYLTEKSPLPAIYGQASAMLKYAQIDYPSLRDYVSSQINGLRLAKKMLKIKP